MTRELMPLNLQDLDVHELERRLEMAAAPIAPDGWRCDCNGRCQEDGCIGHCDFEIIPVSARS